MACLNTSASRALAVDILKRVPGILGCLFFLFSFISPIYYNYWTTTGGGAFCYYWSYKSECTYSFSMLHSSTSVEWFSVYWFSPSVNGLGIPWVLVPMFTFQALTLAFGVVSIIVNRRILSLIPASLCTVVLALMIYTLNVVEQNHTFGWNEYPQGYYLIIPALVLFLSAFILNDELVKKKARHIRFRECRSSSFLSPF